MTRGVGGSIDAGLKEGEVRFDHLIHDVNS